MTNVYIDFVGPDIAGESTDENHKEWIEVLSWNHHFDQPQSSVRSSSGGGTVERVNHGPFVFRKHIDSSTDDLLKMCWTGQHIESAVFQAYRADGNTGEAIKYLEIQMEKVVVSEYNVVGKEGDIPIEEIELTYGKINYTYAPQKETGEAGSAQPVTHDLTTNMVM
jgi:type VI secretion system secreted protein Hcp